MGRQPVLIFGVCVCVCVCVCLKVSSVKRGFVFNLIYSVLWVIHAKLKIQFALLTEYN